MDNNYGGILNPFNIAALMMVNSFSAISNFWMTNGFMAMTGFMPVPDNRKRDSLLASLQHGLRDENLNVCNGTISKLLSEFGNQDIIQDCVMCAVADSEIIFGPETAFNMIQNIADQLPGSRLYYATLKHKYRMSGYSEMNDDARKHAFNFMAKTLAKAGIPSDALQRRKLDVKVTQQDRRAYIAPLDFLLRYTEPALSHQVKALG
jgi:hypothetical protein